MTDEAFLIAALGGRTRPSLRAGKAKLVGRATGAIINAQRLVVATVEKRPQGDFQLIGNCSFDLNLDGRSQYQVLHFASQVRGWIRNYGIQHLALRAGQPTGKFASSPFAYKAETVLQLVPCLAVQLINTQSVSNWVRRDDPWLPELEGPNACELRLWLRAVEMAAFAIQHADDQRYFPENADA